MSFDGAGIRLLLQFDGHLVNPAGEPVVALLVVFGHRCRVVDAHIRRLVGGKLQPVCTIDPSLGRFLAVHANGPFAPLPESAAVVSGLETDRRLAGGERLIGGDRVSLQADPVVAVLEPSPFGVEAPAAETACLAQNYSFGAVLRD